ncbi:MAG: hypothetical protein ILP16_09695 [Spirochaetales bacterium]|nr:hypothetical protein [Spirochaetales bacterium]
MVHVRLIKGASYHGEVIATRKNPDVFVDEAAAKRLVASGYFESLGDIPFTDEPAESAPTDAQEDEEAASEVEEVGIPTEEEKPLKKADNDAPEAAEKKETKAAPKSGTGKAAAKSGTKKAAKSK